MNQTVSARIKIIFQNKEIKDIITIKDTEGARTPIKELKEDVFLTGFTWKPELRPLSKKEVINGKPKPKPGAKKAPGPKGPKMPLKPKDKDDPTAVPEKGSAIPAVPLKQTGGKESLKTDSIKPAIKPAAVKADSLSKAPVKADSLKGLPLKTDVIKAPAVVPLKKQ
jgi:hypothetical protein